MVITFFFWCPAISFAGGGGVSFAFLWAFDSNAESKLPQYELLV